MHDSSWEVYGAQATAKGYAHFHKTANNLQKLRLFLNRLSGG